METKTVSILVPNDIVYYIIMVRNPILSLEARLHISIV